MEAANWFMGTSAIWTISPVGSQAGDRVRPSI